MAKFVPLDITTDFSFGQGASSPAEYAKTAKELGYDSIGIAEHNHMNSAFSNFAECKKQGLKPLSGLKATMDYNGDDVNLILYPLNKDGQTALNGLVNDISQNDGKLSRKSLLKNSDNLIAIIDKPVNEFDNNMLSNMKNVFEDRLYGSIRRDSDNITKEQDKIEQKTVKTLNENNIATTALSSVLYAKPDERDKWLTNKSIAEYKSNPKPIIVGNNGLIEMNDDKIVTQKANHSLLSPEKMAERFKDLPNAIECNKQIKQRIKPASLEQSPSLPSVPNEDATLDKEAHEGLQKRLKNIDPKLHNKYEKRLNYELDTIKKMKFAGYFLIVSDYTKYAKSKDIPVGPGRGSGAGSLAAYSLGITDIDPIKNGLIFERFLNPERVNMPDFDIDFSNSGRKQVVDYIKNKYQSSHVGGIRTYGVLQARSALQSVGRVAIFEDGTNFNTQAGRGKLLDLGRKIPEKSLNVPVSLHEMVRNYNRVKRDDPTLNENEKRIGKEANSFFEAIDNDEDKAALQKVFKLAYQIEGLKANESVHASGYVISPKPLNEMCPNSYDKKMGINITEFDGPEDEKAGLVKFDFLGLKTLDVMDMTKNMVAEDTGKQIDFKKIPEDDKATLDMIRQGKTGGVFQLESDGMKSMLRKMKPDNLNDLTAAVSLYRPGPLQFIDDFCKRKNDPNVKIKYPGDPKKTEPILKETQGIMIYQEQVMQVARKCAGYSLGQADMLRRAMGKKKPEIMKQQKNDFIYGNAEKNIPGAVKLGMNESQANQLFSDIEKFASYGFNKSHAAAYAKIGYDTAYMKRHYPKQFLSATMNYITASKDKEKEKSWMRTCQEDGIKVFPPDINNSNAETKASPNGIQMGFHILNNFSVSKKGIEKERKQNGPFKSLPDFMNRIQDNSAFNSGARKNLALSGALDSITPEGINRNQVAAWVSKKKTPEEIKKPEYTSIEAKPNFQNEAKAAGWCFNHQPIDFYDKHYLNDMNRRSKLAYIAPLSKCEQAFNNAYRDTQKAKCPMKDKVNAIMPFDVQSSFVRQTKNGDPMTVLRLESQGKTYQAMQMGVNKDILEAAQKAKKASKPILINSKIGRENSSLWIDHAFDIDEYIKNHRPKMVNTRNFKIDPQKLTSNLIDDLKANKMLPARTPRNMKPRQAYEFIIKYAPENVAKRAKEIKLTTMLESYLRKKVATNAMKEDSVDKKRQYASIGKYQTNIVIPKNQIAQMKKLQYHSKNNLTFGG